LGERRACLVVSIRVAGCRRRRWNSTTPNYSVNHARSGSNSCSASTAPLAHFDLAALGGYSDALIFIAFRGPHVQVDQLPKSSLIPTHISFKHYELRAKSFCLESLPLSQLSRSSTTLLDPKLNFL